MVRPTPSPFLMIRPMTPAFSISFLNLSGQPAFAARVFSSKIWKQCCLAYPSRPSLLESTFEPCSSRRLLQTAAMPFYQA